MMKPQRLPPQPTDTALARLVRRMLDRIPAVSIGRYNNLASNYGRLKSRHLNLETAYYSLRQSHECLLDDLREMMPNVSPLIERVSFDQMLDRAEPINKISVEFATVQFAWADNSYSFRHRDMHEYTASSMREAARKIAKEHADAVAEKVFKTAMIQRTGREGNHHGQ